MWPSFPQAHVLQNWKAENVGPGVLGSWRGHMNVLQKIVNENIQTALIWEDDADFDPALRYQLQQFASGTKALLRRTSSPSPPSPYGRGWDFLWLGHSKLGPSDNQTEFYVLENDSTAPAVRNRYGKWWNHKHSPPEASEDSTRLIFKAGNGGVGMYAYAVTYESARKALVALSVIPRDGAVDVAYRNFCKGAFGIEFACYGPFPTLVGTHRAAGWAERLSDNNVGEKGRWVDEATVDVKFSTMLNLQRLANEDGFVEAQWAGEDGKKELRLVNGPLNGAMGGLREIDLSSAPPPSWMPSDAR
ncbi:glycosyltransferase family 25 protein [Pseudocercospora fijiensis CIRAD86]|uniref:Glycosyltransferase family 25 protein n=1 Tax=Pseudocercospora fijiensis (strain CIRAD86) TaxID=383855 RepID=M3A0G0_PSEFD|nr:glycosyltransferase family 25 protein [Pseudocercospora fijiensis CIRAD86]EME84644.1 glycosyltransferase family 25 protein [Pseudocercospora fijiensis CIRAD86]